MENSKEVPQKNKFELPCDSGSLLGTYPDKTVIQKDMCTLIFIAALFTIGKTWKHPICSSDEWIRKMWCVHTHTHTHTHRIILLSHKKNKIMSFAAI